MKIKSNINLKKIINEFIFIIFVFLEIFIQEVKSIKIRNINYISEITIIIREQGNQYILNNEKDPMIGEEYLPFEYEPDQILVNGVVQEYTGKIVYNLTEEENYITMKWKEPIGNCNGMFYQLSNITYIDLPKFDSSRVTQTSFMLFSCLSLTSINFGNFNTSLVNNMACMFYNCISLVSLDLSNFDTKLVTNMNYLFYGCSSLISINFNGFNTSSLKSMSYVFHGCDKLTSLNLKPFDTSLVTTMDYLFNMCNSLLSIDLSNFNTSSVINMQGMFCNCESITSLDLTNFDTSSLINMKLMFTNCFLLTSLNIRNFNTSSVEDISYLFYKCISLTSLYLSHFNTKNVQDMSYMFFNCYSLEEINLSNFITSSVEKMDFMFYNCSSLKYLDLSNFDTKKNNDMGNMFFECNSLRYLNLKNFKTSSVINMENLFYGCNSLVSLDLSSFDTSSVEKMENMFFGINKSTKFCIKEDKTPDIVIQLKKVNENFENVCSDLCFLEGYKLVIDKNICTSDCLLDKIYKFEYNNICYSSCPYKSYEFKNSNKCTNLNENNFFNGKNEISLDNSLMKDILKDNIRDNIINKNIDIEDIISGKKEDLILKSSDTIYQITSSDNQNNKKYNNLSTINLGECENILKDIYGIAPDLPLIIFKIDYYRTDSLIPIIGYELFHPINRTKLDLSYCKNKIFNISIPVSIDEGNLFKYDPNSKYYTDECFPYITENGTDILLNDRHDEYNNNNMSICENNCTFREYNNILKESICNCQIKTKQIIISEIINNDILKKNFDEQEVSTNMITMKCFSTLFTKDGISTNIASYIFEFIIAFFFTAAFLFYKFGYHLLDENIKEIIESKNKKIKKNKDNNIKSKIKSKKKESNFAPKKKKKKVIINSPNESNKSFKIFKQNSNLRSSAKVDFKNSQKSIISLNINKKKSKLSSDINILNMSENKEKIIDSFNDFELNFFPYNQALKYDKRTYLQYYFSLLKTKHPIIFSFIPINDYNLILIKLCIFLLFFSFIYAINGAFFNEDSIHKIYEDKGAYNFVYFIPKIIISFVISNIAYIIIKYISLSERNLLEIKNEESFYKASNRADKVRRCLVIKYICFFIISIVFLLFLWYYLSSFGAVFKNTQVYLIKNVLISLSISIIYPFLINLIPGILRILSLKNKNKEWIYTLSKFLQIL